jgi:hypothetical protein
MCILNEHRKYSNILPALSNKSSVISGNDVCCYYNKKKKRMIKFYNSPVTLPVSKRVELTTI